MDTHTTSKQTVLVSDAAEIFVTGLAKIVKNISPDCVTLYAKNGEEIHAILANTPVDLLIFEVNLLSGEWIKCLHCNYPRLHMLGYGNIRNCNIIKEFVNIGLNGYVLKDDSKKEFTSAIKKVSSGKLYFSSIVQDLINKNIFCSDVNTQEFMETMTNDKIREILYLIYNEYSIKEISVEMGLAEKTVEGYRTKLLRLIGATNMVGLALFAEKNQIHHEKGLRMKYRIKERMYVDV